MTKIFISYRRADSRKDAGRIYDRFAEVFGKENVFKDVDNISSGADFRGALIEAASTCDAMLAIIGPQWLTIKDDKGNRRLDNPADFVRIEIETVLVRDSVLVIPVLVDGALMPAEGDLPQSLCQLAYKNAVIVRDDPDFHHDVSRLLGSLRFHGTPAERHQMPPKPISTTPAFNVHAAINDFFHARDERDWESARALLTRIRSSGKAPRVFNVDQQEGAIWEAIEAQQREDEYSILRLIAKHDKPERIIEALNTFWDTYPGFDPDGLAMGKARLPALMKELEQAESAKKWYLMIDLGEKILALDHSHESTRAKTAQAYQKRGESHHTNGDYEQAIADFTRAIELDPNNADYYKSRAQNYNYNKDHARAIADFTRAIELAPDLEYYFYLRGICYQENEDYEQSIADFTRAIELAPDDRYNYYRRSIGYAKMPDKEAEHRADLERAAALGHEKAQEELKNLK